MAGIYIHIPYCKKLCYYCDFHFSLQTNTIPDFISALCAEIRLQKDFLVQQEISTIYFGGGTPSVLSAQDINTILAEIRSNFSVHPQAEISFECNPEDCTKSYLTEIAEIGITRLSIGVQSFDDAELGMLNRRHSGKQAQQAINTAYDAGFTNCTIDVIYGLPNQSLEAWKKNLKQVETLPVSHISAYALTLEPKTALNHFVKNKHIQMLPDTDVVKHFEYLLEWAEKQDFEQYEISNFAKHMAYSQHNTNYWKQIPYLGLGPSAHSYNGQKRFWNIAHNQKYITAIQQGAIPNQSEVITITDAFNEYVMTNLRTKWGVDMRTIKNTYPQKYFVTFTSAIQKFLANGMLRQDESIIRITNKGIMVSDAIITDLFYV